MDKTNEISLALRRLSLKGFSSNTFSNSACIEFLEITESAELSLQLSSNGFSRIPHNLDYTRKTEIWLWCTKNSVEVVKGRLGCVTDLKLISDNSGLDAQMKSQGYIKIERRLFKSNYGSVFLWYKREKDPSKAIIDIKPSFKGIKEEVLTQEEQLVRQGYSPVFTSGSGNSRVEKGLILWLRRLEAP